METVLVSTKANKSIVTSEYVSPQAPVLSAWLPAGVTILGCSGNFKCWGPARGEASCH